jgi:hypothetical protein
MAIMRLPLLYPEREIIVGRVIFGAETIEIGVSK